MYHSNTDCTLIFFWYVVVLLTSTTIIPLIYIEPGILFWILLTVWNKIAENNSPEEVSMWKNHKLHYLNCWVYYAELSILDLWLELVTLYQTDLLIFQQYLNVSLLYHDIRYYINEIRRAYSNYYLKHIDYNTFLSIIKYLQNHSSSFCPVHC